MFNGVDFEHCPPLVRRAMLSRDVAIRADSPGAWKGVTGMTERDFIRTRDEEQDTTKW